MSFGLSRDEDSASNTGEVYAIYLQPEYQGHGLGGELWQKAIDALKERGFNEATVWVLDTNLTARKFYENRDCFLDGESKSVSIGGKEVVEVRYRCELK